VHCFEKAVAHATRHYWPWDALLLTGDLVNDDPNGYDHLTRLLGTLHTPVYCIPGNHDSLPAMRQALVQAPFQIGGSHQLGDWLLVMLNSQVDGQSAGHLSERELTHLDEALSRHDFRHALVALHHHPIRARSAWLSEVELDNPSALFAVTDRYPTVRAIVWGHTHQQADEQRRGVHLLGTPSTCVQFNPTMDGFATDEQPPAYRCIDLHADGTIETQVVWVSDYMD
jgi:Icc protein